MKVGTKCSDFFLHFYQEERKGLTHISNPVGLLVVILYFYFFIELR